MSGDQWFQMWLAVVQVGVGAIVTVVAVFIAARVALGHERRHAVEARSREAAEKLALALAETIDHVLTLHGTINFVIQPRPETVSQLIAADGNALILIEQAWKSFQAVNLEILFLRHDSLVTHVRWGHLSLVDLNLIAGALNRNQRRFTIDELSESLSETAGTIGLVRASLHEYLLDRPLPTMHKPTHWRSPVDRIPSDHAISMKTASPLPRGPVRT